METFIGRLHLAALRNLNARNSVLLEQGDLLPHLVVGSAFRVLVGPSAHLLVLKGAVNPHRNNV